ncbi:glycosyl transferase [Psychroflexus planctonicus]|uniref:Glycosyl transferase n=2 Tax=Psychroflexus planctonicus TaxID=1526575 RepID=A0ABQ1SI57_9FLAO|nr:glycosyl transferase [Psychroflexus planctonicus]
MWFIGFIFLIYLLTLSVLLFSLMSIKSEETSSTHSAINFSIIVAFRNEENNLSNFVQSLKSIQYPTSQFEIILINDHSTDASVERIQAFVDANAHVQLLYLNQKQTGKKAALQVGIDAAQFNYIITTDADCFVPENWLYTYSKKIQQTNAAAIIGSVGVTHTKTFLTRFQYYDLMALQAVGFAFANLNKPILCNGANFCYQKAAFLKVNGFQGNEKQPSGDDVLLLQKFVAAHLKIDFLIHQDNLVLTKAISELTPFVQQRKRWFYKTRHTSSILQKAMGLLLLTTNFSLLGLLIWSIFDISHIINLIVLLIVKLTIDFFLTFELAKKAKLPFCFTDFMIANLFYPFGIAMFFSYLTNSRIKWKQREYQS